MNNKTIKICLAASSGGHLEQLLKLNSLLKEFDGFIVTEKTDYNVISKNKAYYLKQINRKEKGFINKLISNTYNSYKILKKENPDVIITTGVLAIVPLCLLAKLKRKKLIYIESFAKISSPTLTGRLLYPFADQFYIQWPSLKKIYPKAIYKGGIY